jgi:hypothetical protein
MGRAPGQAVPPARPRMAAACCVVMAVRSICRWCVRQLCWCAGRVMGAHSSRASVCAAVQVV